MYLYHPLFCFNQFGDVEGALLREGNVHSAVDWITILDPITERFDNRNLRRYFRGDAAFANPHLYSYLESNKFLYAIRLPANSVLHKEIDHLLDRPSFFWNNQNVIQYHSFWYRAESRYRPRRVVSKVE